MIRCNGENFSRMIDFLKNDIPNCFYMYVDAKKYKLNNPNIKFWINNEDTISTVIMKYYDSIQVYSIENNHINQIVNLIKKESPPVITGNFDICFILDKYINDSYILSSGFELEIKKFPVFGKNEIIRQASLEDLDECAELVCSDEGIGGYYDKNTLASQFKERMLDNMGRNFIIRKNNVIVGHIATYAEFENLAVSAGLIVDPEYRGLGYGKILESYLINLLLNENKRVFTFLRNERRLEMFKKTAQFSLYKSGKFVLK